MLYPIEVSSYHEVIEGAFSQILIDLIYPLVETFLIVAIAYIAVYSILYAFVDKVNDNVSVACVDEFLTALKTEND